MFSDILVTYGKLLERYGRNNILEMRKTALIHKFRSYISLYI